jgi:S-methylmethionine-dependent homocysteine/selenocysteine methylase
LFAAFPLLAGPEGMGELRRYYEPFAALARDREVGFVLETPTWRASPGWGSRLGYSPEALDAINRKAVALMEELRDEYATPAAPFVISGCVGPHSDGYDPAVMLSTREAEEYHAVQIGGPAYYMLNCAHPTHFVDVLDSDAPWAGRIQGLRANASRLSHAELDEAEELDDGNPQELGEQYASLAARLPKLNVLGGCCGTDRRHVAAICDAWLSSAPAR